MPVATLFDLAQKRLVQNIHLLTDVGDLPYSFLEPVLRHIVNPAQLQDLEENCTQLLGETGPLWRRFIKRDIPDFANKPHEPRDPSNWSKVYRKLKKDAEREKLEQGEALKEQLKALQNERGKNKTLIVDSGIGYGARPQGFAFGGRSWGLGTGAPAKTGKVGLDKLKRGMFDRGRERPKAAMMPAHVLAQRKKIVQAPARLVRMAENEGASAAAEAPQQRNMVVSKQSTAALALNRPHIERRPVPQQSTAPPRTSLPADRQFHAPKLKAPQDGAAVPPPKRKVEATPMFHQQKRKRV